MGRQTPSLYFVLCMRQRRTNRVQGKSDACWFLLIKTLLIKNNKKRETALKNEAGGDEKHAFFFFTWPYIDLRLGPTVHTNPTQKKELFENDAVKTMV